MVDRRSDAEKGINRGSPRVFLRMGRELREKIGLREIFPMG